MNLKSLYIGVDMICTSSKTIQESGTTGISKTEVLKSQGFSKKQSLLGYVYQSQANLALIMLLPVKFAMNNKKEAITGLLSL